MTPPSRQVLAWAFYDWANSAFATTVMAGFFPVFFKQYWSSDVSLQTSTLMLGVANSAAAVVVMLAAPVLGAIADRGRLRKRLLILFALLGIIMTATLPLVAAGHWLMAVVIYLLAVIGFSGGNIFYDALIVGVAPVPQRNRVSALGYALGYLGGGLLFAINVWMTLQPARFGLVDASQAIRVSFVMVAIWWGGFALPLVAWVEEPGSATPVAGMRAVREGLRQLRQTLEQLRRLPQVALFLLAYWLYIDGVDTIIRMAVDYGVALGFAGESLIVALLLTQFVGFPAALAYGWLGDRLGAKRGILLAIGIYIIVTVYAGFMDSITEFYVLALVIGLVQGGIQALSRSLYSCLIPPRQAGEFFGFYNMLGKFAAVLGPLLVGATAVLTGSSRYGILSIVILFLAGGALLLRIDAPATDDPSRSQ